MPSRAVNVVAAAGGGNGNGNQKLKKQESKNKLKKRSTTYQLHSDPTEVSDKKSLRATNLKFKLKTSGQYWVENEAVSVRKGCLI